MSRAMQSIDRQDAFPTSGRREISVVSWNLLAPSLDRSGLDWAAVRRPALQRSLRRFAAADVICLQELDRSSGALEDVVGLLGELGFEALVQDRSDVPMVNGTFYKGNRFYLAWAEHRSRALLAGLAMEDGRVLGTANVHLQAGPGSSEEKQRAAQTASALKRLRAHTSWCEVVCGDFNSCLESESQISQQLGQAGLLRAPASGPTYVVKGYASTLDHICCGRGLKPRVVLGSSRADLEALKTAGLPDESNPSDHLPVAALLEVLGPAAPCSQPPSRVSQAVREEWAEMLQQAPPPLSEKRSIREHRALERAFLQSISSEEGEALRAWHTAATKVTATLVRRATHRALRRASGLAAAAAEEVAGLFDPGGSAGGAVGSRGGA